MARNVLHKQSVFIPPDIEDAITGALDTLQGVWAEQSVNFDSPGAVPPAKATDFLGESGKTMKANIRNIVRNRVLRDDAKKAS